MRNHPKGRLFVVFDYSDPAKFPVLAKVCRYNSEREMITCQTVNNKVEENNEQQVVNSRHQSVLVRGTSVFLCCKDI